MPKYVATFGEARMGRFGRAAAWRNMALFGTLDEIRQSQLQFSFPHALLNKEPRLDWAHKAFYTNQWEAIALRNLFDDMLTANDAVSTAIQLTFVIETGFTNLHFLGLAADAMETGRRGIQHANFQHSDRRSSPRSAGRADPAPADPNASALPSDP
jgi:toluene monooxygenase system protein A